MQEILQEHKTYTAAAPIRTMIAALMEGTDAMRKAGELFLPPYPAEKEPQWQDRLRRSTLFAALSDTIDRHSGRPFGQPVTVDGLEGSPLESLLDDADAEGSDLTSFAKAVWIDAEANGMSHIFVDMPEAVEAQTRADELEARLSPRFIHIPCAALFNWAHRGGGAGAKVLTEARWRSGDTIMRWTLNAWEEFKRDDAGQWVVSRSGANQFGMIPLVTVYFRRTGLMQARPPLKGLAELNLQHWQDSSDQRNIESVARCGLLFAKGFTDEQVAQIKVGPKALISAGRDADLRVVEHSGSAVSIGREAIKHLETQMETLGMKPEVSRSIDSTATGAVINESQATTDLAAWALEIERALAACFVLASSLSGSPLPDGFKLSVYRDFAVAGRAQDMAVLVQMGTSGLLSPQAVQRESMRRGLLAPDHDIEQDMQQLAASGLSGLPPM